ncbi:MAG: nucleoside kinase [Elusimicrobiota bacterium]
MTKKEMIRTVSGRRVDYATKHGVEIYRRSLTLLLQCALAEIYPDLKLQVGQTLMHGYFFELPSKKTLPPDLIDKTEKRMREIVKARSAFKVKSVLQEDALEMFSNCDRQDKARALCWLKKKKIKLVFIRNYIDFMFLDCVSHAGILSSFRLLKYKHGFVLQYPGRRLEDLPRNPDRQERLFEVYEETKKWNEILGIHHVPDLNRAASTLEISNLIKVQEAFHEKKIAGIADILKEARSEKKIVFISGPSSSGKTSFVKRLAIQLRVNGFMPQMIHLDDYFLPREKTPLTPDGEPDFENIKAMDVALFKSHIKELMEGRPVFIPNFDFKTGTKKAREEAIRITSNSIILVEGIHGLNPALTEGVEDEKQYRIFVSALTQLCIDHNSRIFTSDSRLMRRIVRDSMFRGHSASETLRLFPKVRQGEEKYIFPFQERADIFFNSSIIYEQAVLKPFLEKILRKVKKSNSSRYYEARRLLNYLEFFVPVTSEDVHCTSILREFIGGSAFNY